MTSFFSVFVIADFNIQDETSIPEDIIDQQHLQEIIDKQQQDIQQQEQQQQSQQELTQKYVGESTAVAGVLNAEDDDDDIIDVNLPFDDSADADSDADIVSIIRSFHFLFQQYFYICIHTYMCV